MVSCNLFGRYGNQLFQVSATIAYALKYNMQYSIPKHGLNFGQKTNYIFPNQTDIKPQFTYTQPNHGYNEIPYFDNVTLNGHFQSEKYFEGFKNEIRKILEFPISMPFNKCAIHVRRGDYVGSRSFPLLPVEYYIQSVGIMNNLGVDHFTVFSDDIEWCKSNLISSCIEYYQTSDAISDLKHMAEYRYMIIANSSYSLFASLINDKECVIAPKHEKWFGKGVNLKTSDLLPERFIQI